MKKLMIAAFAALAMAFGAQASMYYWNITPSNSWYEDNDGPGASFLSESVYVLLATDWDQTKTSLTKALQGSVSYTSEYGSDYVGYTGVKTGDQYFSYGTTDASGESLNVVFVQDAGDEYITWSATLTSTASTDPNMNVYAKSTEDVQTLASAGYTPWEQPEDTPEPTSGLLILVGLAGLALKRKRA